MKTKKVFSKRLAIELRKRGFGILETEVNTKKPEFDVYIFESTAELESAFSQIVKELKIG